jgi:hypothetical protein
VFPTPRPGVLSPFKTSSLDTRRPKAMWESRGCLQHGDDDTPFRLQGENYIRHRPKSAGGGCTGLEGIVTVLVLASRLVADSGLSLRAGSTYDLTLVSSIIPFFFYSFPSLPSLRGILFFSFHSFFYFTFTQTSPDVPACDAGSLRLRIGSGGSAGSRLPVLLP